jgi:hypothetical protein
MPTYLYKNQPAPRVSRTHHVPQSYTEPVYQQQDPSYTTDNVMSGGYELTVIMWTLFAIMLIIVLISCSGRYRCFIV